MQRERSSILLVMVCLFVSIPSLMAEPKDKKNPTPQELIRESIQTLLKIQEEGGQWPYQAYHTDDEEEDGIPFGFRVGGTSIVAEALLSAAPDDKKVQAAVQRALGFVLEKLEHPKMATDTESAYDVRVWGQGFALEFLCRARAHKITGQYARKVDEWIPRLIQTLIDEQFPGGGWHYARGIAGSASSFVTAPLTQSLLLARSQGEKIPDEVFANIRRLLKRLRTAEGGFNYDGRETNEDDDTPPPTPDNALPGSVGRAVVCETTLFLLGASSVDAVRFALNNFYEHWDKLEERRQTEGTHQGEYNIAPYYFFFAHRYVGQAIQMLPEKERAKERERFLESILKIRDEDGTWNDRTFERGRYFGTAMVMLALLGDKTPLPLALEKVRNQISQSDAERQDTPMSATEAAAIKALKDSGVQVKVRGQSATGVDFSKRVVTDAKLKELVKDLKELKGLQTLSFKDSTGLTDEGLSELTKELKVLDNLRLLYLSHTGITDAGLKELQALKRLQVLGLSNTKVTDAGLKELQHHVKLKTLFLANTQVTDEGLQELEGLKDLRQLTVSGCKQVTDEGIDDLKKALPKLRIVR